MDAGDKRFFWRDSDPLWYKDAIIYELHVRAFYDSNGDGIGDFAGLTEKLDYLHDLGITAIWLLPFYPSPFKDDGYDVSDYTSIHKAYGTVQDFRTLIREANYRGIRVINELVLNHTSDQHVWFQRARRAKRGSQRRNYYVWSDTWKRYKEARIIFKDFEPANWTWDPIAEAYYWHRFYSHQPDLNYDSPEVRRRILKVIEFWLDMGVSGIRLDAVPYLYEREGTSCENLPETHIFLKELRSHVDSNYSNRMLLAEANQWAEDAISYFGEGDECHMAYHFPLMPRMFMSVRMEDRFPVVDILQQTPSIPESCQWALFLRNHDELTLEMVTDEERDYMYRVYACDPQARINLGIRRRLAPLLNNDRRKIELMNALLFSLPGTPVVYYGDEIGMGDNFYLGDRDGVRTPMQWGADRNAGFSGANPQRLYLPVNINPENHYEAVNVETQQNNPDSLLWWMKRVIALRKESKAFSRGSIEFLHPDNRKVLAFLRRYENESILVVANFSRLAQYVSLNLDGFIDSIPVEMFGHTDFPPVGGSPYPITLGPYAFYWFSLEPTNTEPIELGSAPWEIRVPSLYISRKEKELFQGWEKPSLQSVLMAYIKQRRWFSGKAQYIRSATVYDVITIPSKIIQAYIILFAVDYAEGEPEIYNIPVALAWGNETKQIIEEFPQSLIAYLKLRGDYSEETGIIYDALINHDFRTMMLDFISRRRNFKGEKGRLNVYRTRKVFHSIYGSTSASLESVLTKGEQTNTSVIYGSKFKLKILRRLEEGISPELEVGRFLTVTEPFTNSPPVAGAIQYNSRQRGPVTIGILHGYIENEGDAWKYTLDALGRYFETVLAYPGEEVPIPIGSSVLDITGENLPEIIADAIGPYQSSVQLMGKRTAELHSKLAAASADEDFIPEPFTIAYQRSLYHSMRGSAINVLQLLRQRMKYLPEDAQDNAASVLNHEKAIIGCLHDITRKKISGMRSRCHGDYHLGQILYTGGDFFIVDFEGEPARPLGERRIKRSPLRDVAGMIRSFHYAAHAALRGWGSSVLRSDDIPVLKKWARSWHLWISAIFLKSYLEVMDDTKVLPGTAEERSTILDAYILDKAIYEVSYELKFRPDWVILPLEGILQFLETKQGTSTPSQTKKRVLE